MNDFKQANGYLTHVQIINEYEDKVRELERDNERLNANNERLKSKVYKASYFTNNRIRSLKKSIKEQPDIIKQAQLKMLLELQGEFK